MAKNRRRWIRTVRKWLYKHLSRFKPKKSEKLSKERQEAMIALGVADRIIARRNLREMDKPTYRSWSFVRGQFLQNELSSEGMNKASQAIQDWDSGELTRLQAFMIVAKVG